MTRAASRPDAGRVRAASRPDPDAEPEERTAGGAAVAELAVLVFRLNGQLLEVAERNARPVGLTAARWQVLGAVLGGPCSVSDAARAMGLSRQAVQRLADALVADGLAEYRDNPSHRRAKLLAVTSEGHRALDGLVFTHRPWANEIGRRMGAAELQRTGDVLRRLSDLLSGGTTR